MATPPAKSCSDDEIRLLLVGKTGTGKSAAANTIVDKKKFKIGFFSGRATTTAQLASTIINGRRVAVMDTPGLFDSAQPYEDTAAEVVRCLTDLDPGPHAVLYVVSISQKYTREDFRTYSRLKNLLGQHITGRMIIILTHGDELEDGEVTVEEYIENVPTEFHTVLAECHQRYVVFNNKSPAVRAQQSALIGKVQQLGGGHHTNPYSGLTPSQVKEEVRRRAYRSFQAEAQTSNYVCQLEQDVLDTQMATQRARENLQKEKQQLEAERREAEKERKANGRRISRYFSSKYLSRMVKAIAGIAGIAGFLYFVIYIHGCCPSYLISSSKTSTTCFPGFPMTKT